MYTRTVKNYIFVRIEYDEKKSYDQIFSCVLRDSIPRFVRPSISRSVGLSLHHLLFFMIFIHFFYLTAPAQCQFGFRSQLIIADKASWCDVRYSHTFSH